MTSWGSYFLLLRILFVFIIKNVIILELICKKFKMQLIQQLEEHTKNVSGQMVKLLELYQLKSNM